MNAPNSQKIAFADALRGIACLAVVIAHLVLTYAACPQVIATLTKIHLPQVSAEPILWFLNNCPVNFGSFGVSLFFVISGFVIPISVSRLNRIPFAISRLFRIIPTYAASLLVIMLALRLIQPYFGVSQHLPLRAILYHITFFNELLGWNSIDGVAWTLSIEMKYYLLCMIIAPMLVRNDIRGILFLSGIITAAVLWVGTLPTIEQPGGPHSRLFIILQALSIAALFFNLMWIGTVLSFHWHGQCSTRLAVVAIIALDSMFFAQMYALDRINMSNIVGGMASYNGAVGLFLLAYMKPHWFSNWTVLNFLAKISYPLYLVHGVIGYAIEQLLASVGVNVYAAIAIAVTIVIGIATLLHRFVELPTQRIGRLLAKKVQDWQNPPKPVEKSQIPARIAA